ncbi:MAG: NAD-dependent epimerase/dehydratase family protein [Alphaproteobacteria bacterium]|nr:NAD-dependent epimerase/dehydratase family protein [Alphaproteobacteria bacterium]
MPLDARRAAWRHVMGHEIGFRQIDIATGYEALRDTVEAFRPDAIVHFAAQRSAPYSMLSPGHKRHTLANTTHSLLAALVETGIDAHLVHLGPIGIYGYSGNRTAIPEGYIRVALDPEAEPAEILYPADAGSIYHMSQAQEQLLVAFYCKNDCLRITSLQQGIVWGCSRSASIRRIWTPSWSLCAPISPPPIQRRWRPGYAGGNINAR